jgi:hypothetical protein
MPTCLRRGHSVSATEAPSAGVGLPGLFTAPLQTISLVPVHTIALPSRECNGEAPAASSGLSRHPSPGGELHRGNT